ncbi:MAG TPA: methyltransferase domain-containing protein [Steroidobacteraceae bacterium]|nr:methyltransferase domain-containing protein [Steroidobacteraceae bacterium]
MTDDVALPEDVRAHRDWLLSFVPAGKRGACVDLGCGTGDDLIALAAKTTDPTARFVGLDSSDKSVAAATARARDEPRVSFLHHRLGERLPFDTATFDTVYSSNLVECLVDVTSFAREVARILRPGGTVIIAHWDMDSQLFDGTDKERVRRLVHAFADWQQAWMDHSDGWMGRRLSGAIGATALFEGTVHARVLTNTSFAAPSYGHARAQDFRALVKRQLVSAEDYAAFLQDQHALQAQGRYFYSITGFAYVGVRKA